VYIIGGSEFGTYFDYLQRIVQLEIIGLVLVSALLLVLRAIGFKPTRAEAEIWMRENYGLYEYIAVSVND
jgi:O-antigen ligase